MVEKLDRTYQSWEGSTSISNFERNNFNGDKLIINVYNYGDNELLQTKEIIID